MNQFYMFDQILFLRRNERVFFLNLLSLIVLCSGYFDAFSQQSANTKSKDSYLLNDSHFHLTNYVQEGIDIHKFLGIMGDKVGRVALFGIPLQQMWNYNNSGEF